jgi:hypothetical protein
VMHVPPIWPFFMCLPWYSLVNHANYVMFCFSVFLNSLLLSLSVCVYHAFVLQTQLYCLPLVERLVLSFCNTWLNFMNPWPFLYTCHYYTACNWNKWKLKLLTSNIKLPWYLIITCNFHVSTMLNHFHSAGPSVLILHCNTILWVLLFCLVFGNENSYNSKLCSVCDRVWPNVRCHLLDFCQVTRQYLCKWGLIFYSTHEVAGKYNGKTRMWWEGEYILWFQGVCDCYMAKYFVVSSCVWMIHGKVFCGFEQYANGTWQIISWFQAVYEYYMTK